MQASSISAETGPVGERGKRLIFVGGSPRSGTTLVQNILDSHPEICGGPEFDNVHNIIGLRNSMLISLERGRTDVFMNKEILDGRIAALIESFLLPYADRRQRRLVSEKTPWNVLAFSELLELFPAARLIFCVRDPRAIVGSMLMVGERAVSKQHDHPAFTVDIEAAIGTVRHCNDAGFKVVPHARVFVAQYEQIVSRPESSVRQLCDFLGVTWDPAMLHPERLKHEGDKTLDDVWYSRDDYYRPITVADMDKWKELLNPENVCRINDAFANDRRLAQLGYSFRADQADELREAQPLIPHGSRKHGGPSTWWLIRYLWGMWR